MACSGQVPPLVPQLASTVPLSLLAPGSNDDLDPGPGSKSRVQRSHWKLLCGKVTWVAIVITQLCQSCFPDVKLSPELMSRTSCVPRWAGRVTAL
jgi:hypothetical protein